MTSTQRVDVGLAIAGAFWGGLCGGLWLGGAIALAIHGARGWAVAVAVVAGLLYLAWTVRAAFRALDRIDAPAVEPTP